MKAKLDITDELNLIKKDLVKVLIDGTDSERYNATKLVIDFIQENRDSLDFEEILQALRITYYRPTVKINEQYNYQVSCNVHYGWESTTPRGALYSYLDAVHKALF